MELNPDYFVRSSIHDIDKLLRGFPYKPRYMQDAPQTLKGLAQITVNQYNGDAPQIWNNKSATCVKTVFQQIHGVGLGIASMIVLLLERCFKIHFTNMDHERMDAKPGVHMMRVFQD